MAKTGKQQHEDIVDDIRFGMNELLVMVLKRDDVSIIADDMMSLIITGQHGGSLRGKKIPDVLIWRGKSAEAVAVEVGNCDNKKWENILPMIRVDFLWGIGACHCDTAFSQEVLGWIHAIRDRVTFSRLTPEHAESQAIERQGRQADRGV